MSNQIDHPYRDLVDGTWLRGNLHNHPRPKDQPNQHTSEEEVPDPSHTGAQGFPRRRQYDHEEDRHGDI